MCASEAPTQLAEVPAVEQQTPVWADVPAAVQQRLRDAGFVRPMPIQAAALAYINEGNNVVLHAATGSGKTLAYLVPLLAKIPPGDTALRAIIVSPSQELAIQIAAEAQRLLPADQVCACVLCAQGDRRVHPPTPQGHRNPETDEHDHQNARHNYTKQPSHD